MSTFAAAILGLVLLVLILPTVLVLILVRRRAWSVLSLQSIATGLGAGVIGGLVFSFVWQPIASWQGTRAFMFDLVGVTFSPGPSLASVETKRAFNGDGFSLSVWALDRDEAAAILASLSANGSLPSPTLVPERWRYRSWSATPPASADRPVVEFTLGGVLSLEPPFLVDDVTPEEVAAQANLIKEALAAHGNRYALIWNEAELDGKPWILDAELFIVDLQRMALIVVDFNT